VKWRLLYISVSMDVVLGLDLYSSHANDKNYIRYLTLESMVLINLSIMSLLTFLTVRQLGFALPDHNTW